MQALKHDRPDPNVCPGCGQADTIRELDRPLRWQPVRLKLDEHGGPEPDTYPGTWNVSDDGEQTTYECGECYDAWETVAQLGHAQRLAHALAMHAEHNETRGERLRDLASGDRLDPLTAAERIALVDGKAIAFRHALAIIRGNGEA